MSPRDLEVQTDAELEARAKGRLGETLRDKYRLDRVLGIGGMATVYAATHRNGKEVALKLLHPEFAHDAEVRGRFLREGYVANQVKHPGAVSVLDDDVTESGGAFLVMELLSGITVQDLWDERAYRVHPAWVTAIILQLLDVIASAHSHGIIHRDLKPANLFVTHEGEVKVLDFGIARMRSSGARTTNLNAILGTPAFMAPEQAMGRMADIDETSDLWAVAAVAFALLVGDVVHPAESSQATLVYAATRPARALGPLAPDAPPAIVAVLERALAFERSQRWPSAPAMRAALVTAALDAYHELPDAAVLREALGVVRKAPALIGLGETLDVEPPSAAAAASTAYPLSGPRASLQGVAPPVQALVSIVAVTTSGIASAGAAPAALTPRARPRGRVRLLLAAAVLGAGALMFVRVRAAERPIADETPSLAGIGPASLSSFSFVAATPSESHLSDAPEPARPLDAAVPSGASEGGPAHAAAAPSASVAKSTVSAAPTSSGSKASCTPPFVMDRKTKRKMWKLECL